MSIFSFKFRDIYKFAELEDKAYELFCWEYNKLINTYSINTDLYSSKVWSYLSEKFGITDEKNIMVYTEIEMDEKNKKHKTYKYVVKCEINNTYFYLMFNDELRGYDDEDYHGYVTDEDKTDKIINMTIYYDKDTISTKEMEETVVIDLTRCVYLPSTKNQFFTISTTQFGYSLKPSYIKELNIDLELNYGAKFPKMYENIVDKLKNNTHGLFLFHGDPGTGKSTFLRKLIEELSDDKTIIYIPSYMMAGIADPEFISFIGGFKNTVLLLEDAENILSNTIDDRTQAVSNILNMTDGLLNDYMNIQIIATFNTKAKMIDKALTRAGRLLVNYKFEKLNVEEANKLAKEIGVEKIFTEPSTLSDIYQGTNQIIDDDLSEPTKIGFRK